MMLGIKEYRMMVIRKKGNKLKIIGGEKEITNLGFVTAASTIRNSTMRCLPLGK